MRCQLVERDSRVGGGVADLFGGQPVHLERTPLGVCERDAWPDKRFAEPLQLGRAHEYDLLRRARDEVVDARVRDQLAAADHDQVVGRERHLAH